MPLPATVVMMPAADTFRTTGLAVIRLDLATFQELSSKYNRVKNNRRFRDPVFVELRTLPGSLLPRVAVEPPGGRRGAYTGTGSSSRDGAAVFDAESSASYSLPRSLDVSMPAPAGLGKSRQSSGSTISGGPGCANR